MAIKYLNYCNGDNSDIVKDATRNIDSLERYLELEDYDILVYFIDHDPDWGEYRGGWHEAGLDGSLIQIEVWDRRKTPVSMIKWLIAHEIRHAYQTWRGLYTGGQYDKIVPAFLKYDGLAKPNKEFMRKWHDQLPEEVDADSFANEYTDFNGVEWWDKVIEGSSTFDDKEATNGSQ